MHSVLGSIVSSPTHPIHAIRTICWLIVNSKERINGICAGEGALLTSVVNPNSRLDVNLAWARSRVRWPR